MDATKTTVQDNWSRVTAFLKSHETDIRQQRHGTNDKIYNTAVAALGADVITSKSVLMIVLSFYRQVQHLTPIYQPNKYYKPRAKRGVVPKTSISESNT